jgi:hypothetical protein
VREESGFRILCASIEIGRGRWAGKSVLNQLCNRDLFRLAFGLGLLLALASINGCGSEPRPGNSQAEEHQQLRGKQQGATNRYDLSRDEERGGHTLARHVARTDDELRERLARERNISAASTWTDRETAETVVGEALTAERSRVDGWMRRAYPRANLALHYNAGRAIGRSLRRGDSQAVDCSSAVIVLRWDGPESFYVLTTYPEARE